MQYRAGCFTKFELIAIFDADRAEQLGRLVSDLFELGKLSAAAETLDREPFPIAELAVTAGASFVARSTVYHVRELQRSVRQAFRRADLEGRDTIDDADVDRFRKVVRCVDSYREGHRNDRRFVVVDAAPRAVADGADPNGFVGQPIRVNLET